MRIAYLTGSLSRNSGGLFTSVRRLSGSVRDFGNDVSIFGWDDEHFKSDKEQWGNLPLTALERNKLSLIGYTPKLLTHMESFQPEIIHPQFLWNYASWASSRYARRKRIPYVISPRGMLDPWAVRNSRWKKRMVGWLFENQHLNNASCMHALCRSEAEAVRAYGLKNPICIIPNGVDIPTSRNSEQKPSWSELIPPDSKALLFLGRVHPKKGLREFIQAWATKKDGNRWHLIVGGWDQGGHTNELEKVAQDLNVSQSVHFVGPLHGTEKHASLAHADAFVLPSHSEGLPISVLEAWSYGLPCLLTDACNLPEGFESEAALRLPHESEAMASSLSSFLRLSPEAREQMGRLGLALVEQKFTWTSIAQRLDEVYRWLVSGAPMPSCVELSS